MLTAEHGELDTLLAIETRLDSANGAHWFSTDNSAKISVCF